MSFENKMRQVHLKKQSTFALSRSIFDNVMVVIEIVYNMKPKLKGKLVDVALKFDTSKASAIIDRNYLRGVMVKMGFLQR